jgi:hypothetical protein
MSEEVGFRTTSGCEHHELSWRNRVGISAVKVASCYYCLKCFPTNRIREWADDEQTALCPCCGIDSVVAGEVKISVLKRWHKESFT